MKLKIVNFSKFIRSIFIILGIIFAIVLSINTISFSHTETKYKTIYVESGDTLWGIAKEEKYTNDYYENKDIRDIVDSIKVTNKLTNSNLAVSQKLVIPYI